MKLLFLLIYEVSKGRYTQIEVELKKNDPYAKSRIKKTLSVRHNLDLFVSASN